jgi:APA family basic amino acid/polyamine antiporter
MKSKLEYIWLDGYKPTQSLRSKTMVRSDFGGTLEECPNWVFDGSSTEQAPGGASDCILKPAMVIPDPDKANGYLVMCEVGLGGLFLGTFLAFYAFIGFEDMVNVIEEVKNPLRNITIAIVLAISLSTFCYVGISYLVLQVSSPTSLAQSDAPLADLVAMAGIDPAFIGLISLLAVINGALVQIVMASRVMYGMTKLKLVPALIGKVNAHTQTPVIATIVVSTLVLVCALLLPLVRLAQLTSLIMLLVFAMVNTALIVIKLRPQSASSGVRVPIAIPCLGVLSSILLIWYLLQSQLF